MPIQRTDFYYHLLERGWAPYIQSWIDWDSEVVTFPLWTLDGKLIGYQKYHWKEPKGRFNKGRYYTRISKPYKNNAVYGLDNCFGHGPLFIVEGIFDALRITGCFRDCLALMCNNPSKQTKQWLKMYAYSRPIIAICDNDKDGAGELLSRSADFSFHVPCAYKDMGELSPDVAMEFINKIINKQPFIKNMI
jgi:hypothetical protein